VSRVFVDANLLCLIVAGTVVPEAIGRHKRLRAFTAFDFDAVYAIVSDHSEVASCPHVLTETSNLISQTHETEAVKLKEGLRQLLCGMHEIQVASILAMERPEYLALGLTDAVILALQKKPANLLTVDLGLTLAAQRAGFDVVNYNWLRDSY
jgi:hypothetical protein